MRIPRKLVILGIGVAMAAALVATPVLARPAGNPATDRFATVLDGLVERGVVTGEQAQIVLDEAGPLFERLFREHRDPGDPRLGPQQIVGMVAQAIGMEPQELVAQLREGQSLAEIIAAQGFTVEEVVRTLSAQIQVKLDEAVAEGKITPEQAEQVLARFQEQARKLIEGTGTPRPHPAPGHPRISPQQIVGGVAQAIGMEPQELVAQLREGQSLAEIIVAQGFTVEEVIGTLSAQLQVRLDAAVAEGKITPEQAEQAAAKFQESVRNVIENADFSNALGQSPRPGKGRPGPSVGNGLHGFQQVAGGVAKTLGIDPGGLLGQLGEGQTLAEIIVAQGSTVEAVTGALSAQLQERLDQALADGKITAEQAEQAMASFQEQFAKVLENPGLGKALSHAGPRVRPHRAEGPRQDARGLGRGVDRDAGRFLGPPDRAGLRGPDSEERQELLQQLQERLEALRDQRGAQD